MFSCFSLFLNLHIKDPLWYLCNCRQSMIFLQQRVCLVFMLLQVSESFIIYHSHFLMLHHITAQTREQEKVKFMLWLCIIYPVYLKNDNFDSWSCKFLKELPKKLVNFFMLGFELDVQFKELRFWSGIEPYHRCCAHGILSSGKLIYHFV